MAKACQKSGALSSGYFKDPPKLTPWMAAIFAHAHASGRKPRVRWEDVSERLHLSKRTLMYYIDIAKLPSDVIEQIAPAGADSRDKLSARQARAIASVSGAKDQRALAKRALEKNWSGDQITEYARRLEQQNQQSQQNGEAKKGKAS